MPPTAWRWRARCSIGSGGDEQRLRARRREPDGGRQRRRGAGAKPARDRPRKALASGAAPGSLRQRPAARRRQPGWRCPPTRSAPRWSSPSASSRYDTIGIDCVAMNVNDVICVGAEPIAMLDFILTERADPAICEQLGIGLAKGAELAGIEIPGGEIAQVAEIVSGHELGGTCVGLVDLDAIVTGAAVEPGDSGDRPPLLRPALERLHLGPQGIGGRPAGRRTPRPPARRGAARADRDLRPRGARAAPLAR